MFKLCLVLVAVLGLSAGGALPAARNEPGALDNVLNDIFGSLSTDDLANLLLSYLFDPEFQQAMQFLFSPDFAVFYLHVAERPDVKEFIVFLEVNGLTVDPILAFIREFLLLPPRSVEPRQVRNGIAGFIEELLALTDGEELLIKVYYHLDNTPEFAALYALMQSPQFGAAMRDLQNDPTVDRMGQWLKSKDVDVNFIIENINEELGWGLRPL